MGCGNVGYNLAEQLSKENHEITLVDTDKKRLQRITDTLDVQGVGDNGVSYDVLKNAGVKNADIFIAVTNNDETNIISCITASTIGKCRTIARVRNPLYYNNMWHIKEKVGLSMYVNPEMEAAREIERLIQIPTAIDVDVFRKSNVNMISFKIPEGSALGGIKMSEIHQKITSDILVCVVERGNEIIIPNGSFTLKTGDIISAVVPMGSVYDVFKKAGIKTRRIKNVIIAGGGRITYYLAKVLLKAKMSVKIIEKDYARCEELSELLPEADIICSNVSNKEALLEEGIKETDAFVSLTENDEENIMLSIYAGKVSESKVITKIKHVTFEEIIHDLDVGSVVEPKKIVSESIISYVRALNNSKGSSIETMYKLKDDRVEAVELAVNSTIEGLVGVKLAFAKLKDNILISTINRANRSFIPGGNDSVELGDRVIVVSAGKEINSLKDILA